MSGPGNGQDWSYKAEEALTNYQFRVVVVGATKNGMTLPGVAGCGRIRGVLQDYPAINEMGNVRKWGLTRMVAAETINAGEALEVADTAGRVRQLTATTNGCIGWAEVDAVENQIFEGWLWPHATRQIHPPS